MVFRILVIWAFASASAAAIADCPKPKIRPSAAGWQIILTDDHEWIARSAEFPGVEVPLQMASPSNPEIYEFVVLPRYENRIGLLQYYAGSPGTTYLVTLIHNAILDLKWLRVIGDAPISEDCVPTGWAWYDDRVEVQTANELEVFDLP